MKHSVLLASLAGIVLLTSAANARADDYYVDRLHEGIEAARTGNFAVASDELRIAAFGFLDQPVLYEEATARLALAQAGDGRPDEARATLRVFLDVERRFKAFAQTQIDPETREKFRVLLVREVPTALTDVPSLAPTAAEEDAKFTHLAPKDRESELMKRAAANPRDARWPLALARLALDRHDDRAAQEWAEKALAIEPAQADARGIQAHVLVARDRCPAAFPILKGLPEESRKAWPELEADLFVCAVEGKSWTDARDASTRIPAAADGRKDVGRARTLLAEQTRKDKDQQARAEKEAQARADKEAQALRDKEEQAQKRKDEQTRKDKDQQARVEKEAQARREKEEQAQKRKDELARQDKEKTEAAAVAAPKALPAASSGTSAENDLAQDHALVLAGNPAKAEKDLQKRIGKDPGRRELRLALLEAACLAKHWSVASKEMAVLVPFTDSEVSYTFYAAVISYETGRLEDARIYLARSAPRIVETPYTRYYSEKIEGK